MANRPRIAFKTIVPKKGFLFNLFAEEIQNSMRNEAKPELREMFYKTVDTWGTKVYFRGTIRTIQGRSIRLLVKAYGSGADLYELVARGARPHTIRPRRAKYLRFQEGYTPATDPYWIGSRQKRVYGDTVFSKEVNHPGFEGRYWDVEIARQYQDRFIQLMRRATERYARRQAQAFKQIKKTEKYSPVERR